jgi:hypothetical protein
MRSPSASRSPWPERTPWPSNTPTRSLTLHVSRTPYPSPLAINNFGDGNCHCELY